MAQQVVRGYFAYHAVPTNLPALAAFRDHVVRLLVADAPTTQPEGRDDLGADGQIADDWLPKPHILHPWPTIRFAVKHPRWEPYAGKPPYGSVRGALSNGRPYRERAP